MVKQKYFERIESFLPELIDLENLEERGGVILYNPTDDDYTFVQLRNKNTGTDLAKVLWTADPQEFAAKVIPLMTKGHRLYGSLHTHPQFRAYPSNIDITELFQGFPINFIYSCNELELIEYRWQGEKLTIQSRNLYYGQ